MNFEDLQKSWQSQNPGALVTINAEVLLQEVRRNQRQFWAAILWRDAREVGVCVIMALFFLHWARHGQSWSWYLLSFCCLFAGAFLLVDRWIQHRQQPVKHESLQACILSSLFQVNHQIWLLKNVFWWYLLPILIGLGAVSASALWQKHQAGLAAMIGLGAFDVVFYGLIYWGVYWLNQFAVRKTLKPRRQELETLLDSLK
jgi:hypothetical protein